MVGGVLGNRILQIGDSGLDRLIGVFPVSESTLF
jgi:hypothetical protein